MMFNSQVQMMAVQYMLCVRMGLPDTHSRNYINNQLMLKAVVV